MRIKLASAKFPDADRAAIAKMCRTMAVQASILAADPGCPKMRAAYLDLHRLWMLLGDEVENSEAALHNSCKRTESHLGARRRGCRAEQNSKRRNTKEGWITSSVKTDPDRLQLTQFPAHATLAYSKHGESARQREQG
jgi:hypothetical protein